MIIGNGGHAKVIREFYEGEAVIIAIGDNLIRKQESSRYKNFGYAVHPKAVIARDVVFGEGTVIMAGVVIQPGVRIGKHVILNTGCTVDHDCEIGDFVHIAPGAHLCGNVKVGEGALVGVGVGIAPNTLVSAWSLVKARRLEVESLPSD